mgnify:FL=1
MSYLVIVLQLLSMLIILGAVPGAGWVLRKLYGWRLGRVMVSCASLPPPQGAPAPWRVQDDRERNPHERERLLQAARSRRRIRLGLWLLIVLLEGVLIGPVLLVHTPGMEELAKWPTLLITLSASWPGGLLLLGQWLSGRVNLASPAAWIAGLCFGWPLGIAIAGISFALGSEVPSDRYSIIVFLAIPVVAYPCTRALLWGMQAVRERLRTTPAHTAVALTTTCWVVVMAWTCWHYQPLWAAALLLLHFSWLLLGSRMLQAWQPLGEPQVLLVLRPFEAPRRREALMRRLAKLWTELGPMVVIAGPDLAKAAFDMAAVLALLSGNLRRLFFDGRSWPADPHTARVSHDLYYPFIQLRCFDDTWWSAFEQCAKTADAILMDVRDFRGKGVMRELSHLLTSRQLHKTILLSDEPLEDTLRQLRETLGERFDAALANRVFPGRLRHPWDTDRLVSALLLQ